MKTKFDRVRALACVGVSLAAADAAMGQEQTRQLLEEVIVTAERRNESILEVPLSITAYGDKQRETMGIMSIQDMVNFAPGVSFNMATDRPSIRGIARQSNFFSLDSPVANYFDGIYTSSVQDAQRRPIFIERTEILRGPQGALSGRGSIAGAFNTISKRPTDQFEAEMGGFAGNYKRYGGEATFSGPLIGEALRARVNGGVYRQDEGYFENVSRGDTEGDQPNNRQIFDLLLDGKLGDSFEYFAKASFSDYDESRRTGISTSPFYAGNLSAPSAYGVDGALMPLASWGLFPGSSGVRLGDTPNNPAFLSEDNYHKFANDFHSRQTLDNHHNYAMHLTWHSGPVDIKWIGGHQNYRYTQRTDIDGTDVLQMTLPRASLTRPGRVVSPGGTNLYMEQREWSSNELTFTSTTESKFSWIFGLYQSNEEYNQEPATTTYPGYPELNNPVRFVGSTPVPVQPSDSPFASVRGIFDGDTVSRAAFGQIDYEFNDQWKATVGLRYNKDEKDVSEAFRYIGNNVSTTLAPILAGGALGVPMALDVTPQYDGSPLQPGVVADWGIDSRDGYRKRDFSGEWDALTGSIGVDFKPTVDDLIYLRVARGYRPGGFNAGFNYNPPMVDEETVNSYEIGYKTTLFNRLQISSSAFMYDYRDIQLPLPVLGRCSDPNDLSTCTILSSFINLPKGESRGIELEMNYAVTDHLNLYLSYGWLDTEIKEGLTKEGRGFQNPDDPAALLPNANRHEPISGQVDSFTGFQRWTQDLSGNSLANSPENRVAANASYTFEFKPGNLIASLSYVWRDEQESDVFETGPGVVPSFDTIGARLLWTDAADRYTVIVYGNNLTDEDAPDAAGVDRRRTGLASAAAPSAAGQAYYPTYNWMPPREYGVELQYRFGN